MSTTLFHPDPTWTLQQLRRHFGMIPAERILLVPLPGTATEKDVIWMNERGYRLCELVDGTLIGKTMGTRESFLAALLVKFLLDFVVKEDLGIVLGADGMLRLQPGLIRVPDVCFISWERLPSGELPDEAIASVSPDMAVEVISKTNTKKEMERKLEEYFEQDVRLVWLVYPKTQTVDVYSSPTKKRTVRPDQTLDGGDVLPGFKLPLKQLFAPPKRRRRSK
jgi:Uma2 family endonuclease